MVVEVWCGEGGFVEVGSRLEVWVYVGGVGGVGAPRLFKGHMGLACGSISNRGGELSIT